MGKEKTQSQKADRYLEHAEVILSRVHQRTTIHNIVLSWRVPKYEELKSNVIYFQSYESLDIKCVLRVFKRNDCLYLCVSGESLPKSTAAEFFILDEENLNTVKQTAKVEDNCVYVAKFRNEEFLGPELHFLRSGVLTVSFKYASNCYETFKEENVENPEVLSDLDDLCCDLRNMYFEGLYYDFLIHVGNRTFRTHKFMLIARSSYFDELFRKNAKIKETTLKTFLPGITHEVLLYLYSCELKEMDWMCMLRVYELALFLGVPTLCTRCLDYFKQEIAQNNCNDIFECSSSIDSTKLRNEVVRIIKENVPDFDIMEASRNNL